MKIVQKGEKTMNEELVSSHKRGMRFLKSYRDALSGRRPQEATWSDLATIGGDAAARKLRDQLAKQLGVDKQALLQDVKFSAAVETIVKNCGPYAREVLLDGERPQKRDGIMRLSRTADTRQRYRVEGVRAGVLRSVAPQNGDKVFDTVGFSEVPSRLRRGRGSLRLLQRDLRNAIAGAVRDESRRLAELCRESALTLQCFVGTGPKGALAIPAKLQKDGVLAIINCREVRGKVVGKGRQALRLTIKSVWDYPEMRQRAIFPTEDEQRQTIQETDEIVGIANDILRHKRS